jgi:hypothetical protein
LSALLFSSSPPEAKQVKIDKEYSDNFMIEEDLEDLLKELDQVEDELFTSKDAVAQSVNKDDDHLVNTMNYCSEKEIVYSAVDSVYKSKSNRELKLLPMIDISTPPITAAWEVSEVEESSDIGSFNSGGGGGSGGGGDCQFKLLLPETFNIEDLREKIRIIKPDLNLNPVKLIKELKERRISFELALMMRDLRQMGSMAQLRLVDGNGDEIVGTLALSACTELKFKLHFGLIFILTNVSIFSPFPGGQKYLNITKQNIQSFHYNISSIRDD